MKKNNFLADIISQIRYQKTLVIKGKSPNNLLNFLNEFQLHPMLVQSDYTTDLLRLHLDAYILANDFIGLKLFFNRKNAMIYKEKKLNQLGQKINYLCRFASNKILNEFLKVGFDYANTQASNGLKQEIQKALMRFCFNCIGEYFLNISLSQIEKILQIKKEVVIQYAVNQGLTIKDGYLIMPQKNDINSNEISEQLLKKMNQIAKVASIISKFE